MSGSENIAVARSAAHHFGLGLVLRVSWAVYRSQFLRLTLLALVAVLPPPLILTFFPIPQDRLLTSVEYWSTLLLSLALSATAGAITCLGVRQILSHQPFSFGAAFTHARRSFLALFATTIIFLGAFYLGLVVLIIPGLMVLCRYFVAVPVCVVERTGPLQALKRSAELTRGYRWKLLILGLLLLLLQIAPRLAINFEEIIAAFQDPGAAPDQVNYLKYVATIGVDALSTSFAFVASAMAYFQLLRVKEGADVRQLTTVFD
ncbi:hypothetical protein AB4037_15045 [Labrys sp. KB_33_2]|uniref:hypothetical protein n=1 Tax=Labrys sp. KB_33_2 TaxID=3237479 RepID=UPI003F91ED58